MNILIVDDQPMNLKLRHAVLEAEGHAVRDAKDGVEALAILNGEPVDAIISDILMPKMDGYQLCHEVRKSEQLREIPFVFYTATYTSPGDEKLCLELGADKYLRKPAPADVLFASLQEVTKSSSRSRAPFKPMTEISVMKEYNESLVAKLEDKNIALEESNAALSFARGQMAHLLAHCPAVIYALKVVGGNVFPYLISENIIRLLGFTVVESCDYDWWTTHLHPEDRERAQASLQETLDRGSLTIEYRIRKKDDSYIWVEDNRRTVCDSEGRAVEISGVWTDITRHRQLENQLRQSQKMEAVGLLAGGIAHDFNNLLTVINGRSQLLMMRRNTDDKTRVQLELIYKTGERAAALTRQLLAFSRQQVLEPKVVNLNSVARDMESMLHRLIPEDISIQTMFDPTLRPLLADPGQIEQVIMNLVVNARDAMSDGGKMTIETTNVELSENYCRAHDGVKPGHYVMLAVSDTGMGMNAAVMAKIFEPFFTTKGVGKGTGLGLSTVYGIVKQSNGHVEVYSELGKGTVFKIYLPQAPLDAMDAKAHDSIKAISFGNETVLLVEDDPGVRDFTKDILEMNGYTVLTATDGRIALQICTEQKHAVNLVITDVVMPEMGGPELVERLQTLRPDLKVIFTSGYPDHAIVHNGALSANVNFIQKPFIAANLANKVREILDGV